MSTVIHDEKETTLASPEVIEISVKGRWVKVPSLRVDGKNLIIRGNLFKTAIVESEEWLDSEVTDPEACIRVLRDCTSKDLKADIFTFAQKVPGSIPKYNYRSELDSIAMARVDSFGEWWEGLPQETRKNVRRSQKRGVIVRVQQLDDEVIRGIMGVNNDSRTRQGIPYVHFGKSFDQVKRDQSSHIESSEFICAYYGDEMIGFLKLVIRGEVASILQILPKISHQDKRPANALIAKAAEVCEARGVRYMTYGKFNYGKKRENPLREFKIRNGFCEALTPRYFVPLTVKGKFCINLNLHLGLIGILPHQLIVAGVTARSKWYAFKHKEKPV